MSSKESIRIGCASGFWGDSAFSAAQLVNKGNVDFIVFDYLAEITMSILARAKVSDERLGYATDFVTSTMKEILADIKTQNIKVISNAGGLNPIACKEALEKIILDFGLDLTVAAITGDDVLSFVESANFESVGGSIENSEILQPLLSANAYLGAFPIVYALRNGADIVITGRCVDSALVLGPCLYKFSWGETDYDRLANASIAGHIVECGAQATGGNFTDWDAVDDWADIGYPIVEVFSDGKFVVSKPENTGGLVSYATVCEQLLYEIGDTSSYVLPDVICDIRNIRVTQLSENRVLVSGVKGYPPTDTYKVSATYQDGYRVGMYICIAGRDAEKKADRVASEIFRRMEKAFSERSIEDFSETSVEIIGAETAYGNNRKGLLPREVVLKIAAKHSTTSALSMLIREATSSATSMAPGIHGFGGLRPRPSPLIRLLTFYLPKESVEILCHIKNHNLHVVPLKKNVDKFSRKNEHILNAKPEIEVIADRHTTVPLIKLAWGRSGDKGNDANIGIIARRPEYFPYIKSALTEGAVAKIFAHVLEGSVVRYEIPSINALNFVLHDSLGGGGMASLRNDPQGKAFAQVLLDTHIAIPNNFLNLT